MTVKMNQTFCSQHAGGCDMIVHPSRTGPEKGSGPGMEPQGGCAGSLQFSSKLLQIHAPCSSPSIFSSGRLNRN